MLLSVERRGEKLLVSVYGDFGFRRELEVDFVLYGPHGKYSVTEGVLDGVEAAEVVEVGGDWLLKKGLPAEEGKKYRVLLVTRW
jgi:hypothetical protein